MEKVIEPKASCWCASILWRSADKASAAAEALAITAPRLQELGLIDRIVNEPIGGAHRDYEVMAAQLKRVLEDSLRQLIDMDTDELIEQRLERLLSYGRFQESK